SSKVQCVVDWFGPTDFRRLADRDSSSNSLVAQLLGGPPKENKDKAVLASPIVHVTKNCAPFLIMHGDRDPLVQLSQSEALTEALKKADVEVTLVKLEGAGHGGAEFSTAENRQRIEEFFAKHLKAKK